MYKSTVILAMLLFFAVGSALAEYSVNDRGEWPKSWPKQLESLRNQSRTLVGPMVEYQHFAIPFAQRAQFEAAWPYILKVKTKGTPIHLVSAPNFFLNEHNKAGVVIHCPPLPQPGAAAETGPTSIDLVVDGDIIDLKRIKMPKGAQVIDDRAKLSR